MRLDFDELKNKLSGVLFVEGSKWSHHRRLTTKYLRAFGFGQPTMQEDLLCEAKALVNNLGCKGKNGKPVTMHTAFDVAVLNALWTMLGGFRFSYDDPDLLRVQDVVHDAFRCISLQRNNALDTFVLANLHC